MESYMFAYLAYRRLNGLPTSLSKITVANSFIYGGVIYTPLVTNKVKYKF